MSFVVGFVTGMATGESVERRKRRRQFREYMSRQGFKIIDQQGNPVPLESVIDDVLAHEHRSEAEQRSKRVLVVTAGIAIAAIVVITGGTAIAIAAT